MSYYTYFYPIKEQFNPRNLSDEEIAKQINTEQTVLQNGKLMFKVFMVECYYGEIANMLPTLRTLFYGIVSHYKTLQSYDTIRDIAHELANYSCVAINHAECPDKGFLQSKIDDENNFIENQLASLAVLAAIKPFTKAEYKGTYNSNEVEYLQTDYMEAIDDVFANIGMAVSTISSLQFQLDYFDTKKEEKDLADDEQ